ncbi:MAG: hypothetical protein M1829_005219 [Trizodia sp. TS-e1964]|nr:MAG: hypothetical protein M1829_005219 [Trizodia sp. TS-e1964]
MTNIRCKSSLKRQRRGIQGRYYRARRLTAILWVRDRGWERDPFYPGNNGAAGFAAFGLPPTNSNRNNSHPRKRSVAEENAQAFAQPSISYAISGLVYHRTSAPESLCGIRLSQHATVLRLTAVYGYGSAQLASGTGHVFAPLAPSVAEIGLSLEVLVSCVFEDRYVLTDPSNPESFKTFFVALRLSGYIRSANRQGRAHGWNTQPC